MNFDAIIARLARQLNRHVLKFPEHSQNIELPSPTSGRPHLLYLHVPYCISLCPFCTFHRVQFEEDSALHYFDCLRQEIDLATNMGYEFDEVYIGGGTPTVLPDELIKTIQHLRSVHPLDSVSVETNPDNLREYRLTRLNDAGVNRLSVGVQSFDDKLLHSMQRLEKYGSGAEIQQRLAQVNGIIDTINVDMIFNLPQQSEESLRRDLDILIDQIGVDQVSFYPLMVSESSRNTLQQAMGTTDTSNERAYYELIADRMLSSGYERTSAWCFSRKAGMFDEYIVDREEYLGLGSGAFSYLEGSLYSSTFAIDEYKSMVMAGKAGTVRSRKMSLHSQAQYYMLMRLFGGSLDKSEALKRFGNEFLRTIRPELTALHAIGAIADTGGKIVLTESGQYLWVILMREFFTGINNLREQMKYTKVRGTTVPLTGG